MQTAALYENVQRLPAPQQQEISDFVSFLLNKYPSQNTVKPRAGCMKGTFTMMSDDFNAPLEDFKDYQ
ncbi:MAG: DUF2281 domain-containing protein [Treponema sp.]|jgi:hypothetical protein|nr:DUF2281 domain-containing protein [Treponema sp.]